LFGIISLLVGESKLSTVYERFTPCNSSHPCDPCDPSHPCDPCNHSHPREPYDPSHPCDPCDSWPLQHTLRVGQRGGCASGGHRTGGARDYPGSGFRV